MDEGFLRNWKKPTIFYRFSFFVVVFLGPHPRHMEIPKLGGELELQLPASTTVTAKSDLSHVCNLSHSSWQHRILNPLSKARDWICILMDASQMQFCWARTGTPILQIFVVQFNQLSETDSISESSDDSILTLFPWIRDKSFRAKSWNDIAEKKVEVCQVPLILTGNLWIQRI